MEDVCHRRTVVMRVKCSGKENRFSGGCDNDENELWRQERLWADGARSIARWWMDSISGLWA